VQEQEQGNNFQEQQLIVPFRNRNKENSATWQCAIRIWNMEVSATMATCHQDLEHGNIIGSNWTCCDNLGFFWIGSDMGLLVTWGILHHFWNLTWGNMLRDQQLRTGVT